jgi:hypothetical protein
MSLLKRHIANDAALFPSRETARLGPIFTVNSLKEYLVEEIIDVKQHGRGWQFLVHWLGYGPKHDLWIPASELNECEALDCWYKSHGDGPDTR